jgi:heme-degrading monooxygenase HmoA
MAEAMLSVAEHPRPERTCVFDRNSQGERCFMFARFVELNIKVEKRLELIKKVKEEIRPILKKQPGYVDILALENEFEPNKPFVVTFWHTKTDIERYEKETFPKVKQILEPFLYVPPVVKFCRVEETITEKWLETVAA